MADGRWPLVLREPELGQRVSARTHGVRADQEHQQVAGTDRFAQGPVVGLARDQLGPVEENPMPFRAQRQRYLVGERALLGSVGNENVDWAPWVMDGVSFR